MAVLKNIVVAFLIYSSLSAKTSSVNVDKSKASATNRGDQYVYQIKKTWDDILFANEIYIEQTIFYQ